MKVVLGSGETLRLLVAAAVSKGDFVLMPVHHLVAGSGEGRLLSLQGLKPGKGRRRHCLKRVSSRRRELRVSLA